MGSHFGNLLDKLSVLQFTSLRSCLPQSSQICLNLIISVCLFLSIWSGLPVFISLVWSVCLFQSDHLCLAVYLNLAMSVCLSQSDQVCLSQTGQDCKFVNLNLGMSVCISQSGSICLSIYLSTCVCECLFTCSQLNTICL